MTSLYELARNQIAALEAEVEELEGVLGELVEAAQSYLAGSMLRQGHEQDLHICVERARAATGEDRDDG